MVSKVLTLVALLHGGATAFASPGTPGAVNASRGPEKALLFGGVESFLAENGCGNCHACGTPVGSHNTTLELAHLHVLRIRRSRYVERRTSQIPSSNMALS